MLRRILSFALSVLASAPLVASAQNGVAICNRISTQDDQMQCLQAVAGQDVDPAAVDICGRISTNGDILQCARAVAGRRVDASAAQICNRISTNGDIVQCASAVAGYAVPQGAVDLCGRISTNGDIVQCARTVAGHTLDAGAVRACGRVSTNGDIVQCASAIADKTYGPEELAICDREGSNGGIVRCLQSTGRAPVQAPPPPPPSGGGNPTIVNDLSQADIARVYARAAGASRWPAARWRGFLRRGDQTEFDLPPGQWDICIETASGWRTFWRNINLVPGHRLLVDDTNWTWEQGECRD